MEADTRVLYLAGVVSSIFGTNKFDKDIASSPKVGEFLNELNCASLQCLTNGAKIKFFVNTFGVIEEGYQDVHFIKRSLDDITESNVTSCLLISTMRFSPVDSLYQYIKTVYEPLLVNEQNNIQNINSQMKTMISSLKAGLSTVLKKGSSRKTAEDEKNIDGILTPVDEIEFWADIEKMNVKSTTDEKLRQKAENLNRHLSKISKPLYEIDTLKLVQINDLVDELYDTVDNIWTDDQINPPYGEDRMKHFLKVLTGSVRAKIEKELNQMDVWTSSFSDVRMKLNECMKICKSWRDKIADLTGTLWKTEGNKWSSAAYYDPDMERLIGRLTEIFELRSQHDELMRLFSPEDQTRLNVESAFDPFRQINCFYYNEYQSSLWSRAVAKYQDILAPMKTELCDKLRKEIFAEKCEPTQRLNEFQRWKGLLSIEGIKQELKNERSSLLTQLNSYVAKLGTDFESKADPKSVDRPPLVNNMSRVVNDIVWARQLESSKILSIQKVAEGLFADLDGINEFRNTCRDLVNDIREYEKRNFNKWISDIQNILKSDKMTLDLNDKLMEIDPNTGILKVYHNEKKLQTLIGKTAKTIIKDSRQLQELGFKVPKQITQVLDNMKKFYREGVTLRQVANFFNNMSSQIMECHSVMLLRDTVAFEKIIKGKSGDKKGSFGSDSKDITWSNPVEFEEYIQQIQEASNKLMTENRKLRKIHIDIIDYIVSLMNVDLLKNKEIWKERLSTIKRTLDSSNYNAKETKIWRTHLDYQLFKALEYQYQIGLESLNENFNMIEADLVYLDKAVSFRPPLEMLRSLYYKEIQNFINIPIKFSGLGGKPSIFRIIPNKNSESLHAVYAKAEELFARLDNMLNTFLPWTALGYFDLETYIEENFKDVKDWENNFKMLRVKRKELEKLNESYKIDNFFNIRMEPFKKGIEDLLSRMNDILKLSLRSTIKVDIENIDQFIDDGMKKLNARPQSVEEIGKAKAEAVEIASKKSKYIELYNQCEQKNYVLMQISGEGAHIGDMQSRWKNFDVALNAFSSMIDEQKNVLKQETDKRIKALNGELEKTFNRWEALKPKDMSDMDRQTAMETSEKMKEWREKWDELEKKTKNITADCDHFGIPLPQFSYYEELKSDLAKQEESWRLYDEFYKELAELGKEDWLSFSRGKGIYQFQDFTDKWFEKLKSAFASNPGSIVKRLLNKAIDQFRDAWPLFKICVGEAFEKEHWRALFYIIDLPKSVTVENLKFINFLDAIENMVTKTAEIKDLGARAQGEVSLREAIQELRAWCDQTEFVLTDYVGGKGRTVPLIKEWKDIMNQVSDNQSLLISMKESRFFQRFSDQVEQFESKLTGIDEYLQKLNVIQRKWVYLEPIFIRGALPSEQARFNRVDSEYVSIMMGIGTNPKVVSLCEIQGLKETLDTILSQLDVCQKALNDFLEEKRSRFPRFYFIGDDDLLEILGQATNPLVIQSHLKKLFAGIFKVDFNKDNTAIVAMKSSAGEVVELSAPVKITEEVEIWLRDLVNEMKMSLSLLLKSALNTPNMDIVNTPSQICCLSEMVHFSNNAIQAIKKSKLSNYKIDLQKTLEVYTSFDHGGDMLLLSKLKALTLDIIHNIEIIDVLINTGVKNPEQWGWYKQLKYSIDPRRDYCNVGMCDAIFEYTFEYQGNAPKLVHTPLTDKCYLTLTQGMKMGYGGNPYGPAGTGKTESVKALGQAFGRQVLVFNCDEGIDFKSMGRIFIGLVKCGAWGCFDEFNRLLEEQLSAISQQIQIIQWAIKQGEATLELLNRTVEVNKNAGIFVTMNPAGKGYGGRSKLPDNLKQLFRPVAMSAPDNELIAEVLLFAEGFKFSKQLSQKLIPLFTLSRQLLSPQQHYDWGLRALKTILTVGGQLIQKERLKRELKFNDEALILIKAIRINTMSKLTFGDSKKFEFLLNDMFPGIKVEDIIYENLEKAIHDTLIELNLENNPKQLSKMLQFHEATRQRMGVVIVGPSGCGKSTIWKVLRKAYEKLSIAMSVHVMNPKSMLRQQLLGEMNHDTREFKDGVLTMSARKVVKEPTETRCWIICDGDIDPEWIESLNSVLDDNHLLTLPNGERISFGDNVNFIFESDNLKFASPATVSRMGMIFLSEEDVNVSRLIHTWIKKQDDESMKNKLDAWMEEIFYKALDWVLKNEDKWVIETTKVGIVHNVLSSLQKIDTKAAFVYGIMIGLGGNLKSQHRNELAQLIFQLSGERPADATNLLNNYYDQKTSGFKSFVFDSKETSLSFENLKNMSKSPIVETISAQRDSKMIEGWFLADKPFILVGPEGCGKSLIITNIIKKLKSTSVATIHCNAQTSAFHIIQKLNQMCTQSSKSQGRVYRPKDGQKLIIYLKDINLPKPDKYDTIQLIAFLHQIVCYQGFYDENLEFVYLERIQVIASMTPATVVGRHKLSCRFTANVCIAYIEDPPTEELESIYSIYIKTILSHANFGNGAMCNSSKKIAKFCVDTYENVKQKFSVDDYRHYLLTPKELTRWIFGLMRYEAQGAESLVEILTYEAFRLFKDRLVNIESKQALDQLIYGQLRNHLKFGQTIGNIYYLSKISSVNPMFPGQITLGRIDKAELEMTIKDTIKSYEREYKDLDVILVDELLEKFVQLEKSLSQNEGHVLLAGRSGTGRRTCCQLIAHMLNLKFETPKITRDYSLPDFKKYLKSILIEAGVNGVKTILFLEDHQMCEPEFYEYLNSLMSSGEVPGLFAPEELEPLLSSLQDELRNEFECRTVYEVFLLRVVKNMRIVLSLDSKHPDFISNCSSNPALTTKSNVIWSETWSKDSMNKVMMAQLSETFKNLECKQEDIVSLLMQIHINCIEFGATPLHFFHFIENYKLVLKNNFSSQTSESKHLIAGLSKLQDAAEFVDKLSKKAQSQKELLKAKQAEADAALAKINIALEKKAERKQEAEKLRKQCLEDEEIIKERKVLIEEELVDIMPEVEAAKQLVGDLKQDNLNEIKAFRVPPDPVHDVLGAVLYLMGVQDTTWGNMKKFLSQRGVIQNIMNFDAHYITKDIRDDVNKIISKKKNSFEDKVIRAASVATAPLAAWVKANVKYSEVLLKIEPLENEMNALLQDLGKSQKRVYECTKQLEELEDSTKILNNELKEKTNEAAELKLNLQKAEKMLQSAQNLLLQLSGEKDRWEIQVEEIKSNIQSLPFKSLLSAACIIYTGRDDEKLRLKKISEWKQMLKDSSFDFIKFMSSESQILKWKTEGLPSDELSIENAIMLRNTVKTPMIFDPATQATEWMKSTLKAEASSVEFLTHNDPKYNTKLEISVRFGKVCVIEEVDGVDKMLFPILRKDLVHQGPRWVVQCGDKLVDYNETFKLYFATRDPHLDIPPNASPLINIINFTVTQSGLESQLLSITINFEEPDLEKKRTEILQEEERFKIKLSEYQKSLLNELANSEGNILEYKQLVDSLNNTKAQSTEIEKVLKESHKFQVSLDNQRNIYRSFATIGADLFMVIEDLYKLNNMYQFSLASFIKLFKKALESKPTASSVEEKLRMLSDTLIKFVFFEIGRSLFKSDRLTYGLHFIHGIFPKLFSENEWEYFIGTAVSGSETSQEFPRWSTPDRKPMFQSFANLFPKLIRTLQLDNQDLWLPFAASTECEKDIPTSVKSQITPFQKLLVVKTFRPDRLESAMNSFVCEALGKKTIAPAPLSLKSLYENDTDCFTPILFITSPGSDPSDELQEFAAMEVGRQGYHELAMGGGENQAAIQIMKEAAEKGEWVCLKNLHLVTPWLTTLEKEFKLLTPDKKFRLWLTSEPHNKFPSILLKTSLTITYESPPGIKNNMQRTFQSWTQTFDEKNLLKSQTLFILAWFNSIIQERRKYIPQGWSKYYEFSYGDLKAGETILGEIIESSSGSLPQWEIVHGLLENAIYGGRIDNSFDMKVLKTYLKQFFSSDVFQGTKKLSNAIPVPKTSTIKDYLQYVAQLPDHDSPQMFGLPPNIDRSVQRFNSQKYINELKAITAISKEDLKFDREMWSKALGPILKLWKSIYKPDGFRSIKIKPGNLNSEDPVEAFVYMEAQNMLVTLQKINESLSSIARVIKGAGMLTSKIEKEATDLLKREVPEYWCSFWEGPENPQDWLILFERKASALLSWIERTQNGGLLETNLNLSDLFHPETFFNALRQKCGRTLGCPIDELKLVSAFEKKSLGSKMTVKLEGMYLQGAGFENGGIIDQFSENLSELIPLPVCNLAWIRKSDSNVYSEDTTVSVPVYFTIVRDSLLCELNVPNSGSADAKIISGVAIVLDGSD